MIKVEPNEELKKSKPFYTAHGAEIFNMPYGFVFKNIYGEYYIISNAQLANIIQGFSDPKFQIPALQRKGPRLHG